MQLTENESIFFLCKVHVQLYMYKLYIQKPQNTCPMHHITSLLLPVQEFPVRLKGPGNSSLGQWILINIIKYLIDASS